MIKTLLCGNHKDTGNPVVLRYQTNTTTPYIVEELRKGVYYQVGRQYVRKGDAEKLFKQITGEL